MDSTWTITELAERAGAALADEPVRVNGRVRETPNERLIRWYTTIGLVDPPSARRGRTALYGPRHLLQLVAIKRRQADGLAIAEIQAELTGATDAILREIARLPDEITADTPPQRESRTRFWTDPPSAGPGRAEPLEIPAEAAQAGLPAVVAGIRLGGAVTLLLDNGTRPLGADDLAAIDAAAGPLLDELRRRGLLDQDDRR